MLFCKPKQFRLLVSMIIIFRFWWEYEMFHIEKLDEPSHTNRLRDEKSQSLHSGYFGLAWEKSLTCGEKKTKEKKKVRACIFTRIDWWIDSFISSATAINVVRGSQKLCKGNPYENLRLWLAISVKCQQRGNCSRFLLLLFFLTRLQLNLRKSGTVVLNNFHSCTKKTKVTSGRF